ncbi:preprotein translocase subunit YajC [Gordonia sp. (in: high G+C Gram-positive bacteria)]|uniref:preprotein translocase subunit YajC n=1 Tax=Gordonia sp. (in: high G+C Gram-positive bacteria) TaxID=84139 RepID=UPI001D24A8FA|nr:preprotein translocase subunit YajC [Gordonia sp. (in: high G+C Gram-positive bacteria)]MCB1294496.1 preprotein translocase subunit YajC [Gordonia sp. (in: high G+C Gram-positive bacteria)]HMS76335.1 preprotein translocase subunit YajC [Gordonia sp. (in: high G+C Gram-positive bacteria)]HQV19248.1 preprotein translocase subunit YajC [Gordonia sp. (in: high G+C Gram-positive bacteria)]
MELLFPLMLALMAGFMFISIRKQKKRMQEMQEMQNDVSVGTRLQLTSGLFGTVVDADNSDYIDVEIATGVVTRWNRLAIMRVVQTEDAAETYPGAVSTSYLDDLDDDDDDDDDFVTDDYLDEDDAPADTDIAGKRPDLEK